MTYCLNPNCQNPRNPDIGEFCLHCGTKLLLDQRYRPMSLLGAGGMGRNFLAIDERTPTKRSCVIKQFFPVAQITENPTAFQKAVELFNREAAMLDELGDESPQIPRLLAHIEQNGQLFFVQEFIDGQNLLKELQQQGSYSELQIFQLLADLLPVLQFIHHRGVVHRDIKPENIMRRQNKPLVLIDFGISKELSNTIMTIGTTVGTLGYAPPEQMTYGESYPASDIYALGATCIHLLSGTYPNLLYNPQKKRWIWPEELAAKGVVVSNFLQQILNKMLQEDIRQRYQSAEAVLQDLQQRPELKPPNSRPPKLTIGLIGGAVAILLLGVGIKYWQGFNSSSDQSFQSSCQNISVNGDVLSANCRRGDGNFNETKIPILGIENIDGKLMYTNRNQPSSFQNSCQNISIVGNTLSANCSKLDGQFNQTNIRIAGIYNNDGQLTYKN